MIKDILRKILISIMQIRKNKCPQITIDSQTLILAPHPDDEIFGCAGLILQLVSQGKPPHIVIMTGGGASHKECCDVASSDVIAARRELTLKAAKELGLSHDYIHFLDFEDGRIGNRPETEVEKLKNIIATLKPKTLLVPHNGEGWPDHLAVRTLGLDLAYESTSIYEYCVWMWYYRQKNLDWHNASKLKMSKTEHLKKHKAIANYISAYAPCGNPWVGVLPKLFIKANSTDTELYFRLR